MSGIITLTDTIKFRASNGRMSAVQRTIAARVPDSSMRLKRWLRDLSGRCSPFADFDVRGLIDGDRKTLLAAIRQTAEATLVGEEAELYDLVRELDSLIEDAKKKFPEYPSMPFSGPMEDLDQIWGTEDVDVGASMDRVLNDINGGRAQLLNLDELMLKGKKLKEVEPGGTDKPAISVASHNLD